LLAEIHVPKTDGQTFLYIIIENYWTGQQSIIIFRLCIHTNRPEPTFENGTWHMSWPRSDCGLRRSLF